VSFHPYTDITLRDFVHGLMRAELPRGDAADSVGTGERQARRIVAALIDKQVLASEGARAPLRLVFPAALASRWMPGLFPERTE
jgi:hypothetical protein